MNGGARGYREPKPILLLLGLLLSGLGAIVKLYGGLRYESRAVLIDGITCIANIAAGAIVLWGALQSRRPPDLDHPYGHERLVYTGILFLVLAYAFGAGLAVGVLFYSGSHYRVEPESAAYALAGSLIYALSVIVSRQSGSGGESYAFFTISEVLEGIVSAGAALGGAEISSIIDYAGAAGITLYIFYEIAGEARLLAKLLSDAVEPAIVSGIRRRLENLGFRVEWVRLRPSVPGHYIGDALVRIENMPLDIADLLVDELVENLRSENIELTVHIDYARNTSLGGHERGKSLARRE